MAWATGGAEGEFTALSLERQLQRRHLYAFEGKLKDWQGALQQAFRYRYYADKSIVVMPTETAAPAIRNLAAFHEAHVGFWTFDRERDVIKKHYTPTGVRAMNRTARSDAVSWLSSKVNLSTLSKRS